MKWKLKEISYCYSTHTHMHGTQNHNGKSVDLLTWLAILMMLMLLLSIVVAAAAVVCEFFSSLY